MKKNTLGLLMLLAVIGCLGIWLSYRWAFPPFTPSALPEPNGYDDLLTAAEMLAPRTGFYDEMDEEELAAVVAHNEPALQLARKALAKECMVPLDWSAGATWVDQDYLDKCSEMRSVARAFAAETRQASMLGDSDTAIRCGIDNFRLGCVTANGGLNVDWLVGQAIGSIGRRILREQIEQCSEAQCQQIMEAVEKQEPYLESPSQVLQRERAYYRHTIGLMGAYTQLLMHRQLEQALELLNNAEQLYGIMRDLLRVHVAIRQFELAEERLPENLSDLVPQYLSRVPIDPYAKSELTYRLKNDSYLLYSFGPNQIDDGGVESTGGKNGDLLLRTSGS